MFLIIIKKYENIFFQAIDKIYYQNIVLIFAFGNGYILVI